MTESNICAELRNIVLHEPLFPGDTLSGTTVNECVRRGWASRDADGFYIATEDGLRAAGVVNACGCRRCRGLMMSQQVSA